MGYSYAELEDALMQQIQTQLPYLATVETYAGQVAFVENDIQVHGVRFPAVLVLLQDEAGRPSGKTTYEMQATFRLLIICRNLRGQEAARREDRGAYRILGDLQQALIDQKLGLDMAVIRYLKTETIKISQDQVIYAADYQMTFIWP